MSVNPASDPSMDSFASIFEDDDDDDDDNEEVELAASLNPLIPSSPIPLVIPSSPAPIVHDDGPEQEIVQPTTQAEEDDMLARAIALSIAAATQTDTTEPSVTDEPQASQSTPPAVKVPQFRDVTSTIFGGLPTHLQSHILDLRSDFKLPFSLEDVESPLESKKQSKPISLKKNKMEHVFLLDSSAINTNLRSRIYTQHQSGSSSNIEVTLMGQNESDSEDDETGSFLAQLFHDPTQDSLPDSPPDNNPYPISPLQISIKTFKEVADTPIQEPLENVEETNVETVSETTESPSASDSPDAGETKPDETKPGESKSESPSAPSPSSENEEKNRAQKLLEQYISAVSLFIAKEYTAAHFQFRTLFHEGNIDVSYHLACASLHYGFAHPSFLKSLPSLHLAATITGSSSAILYTAVLKASGIHIAEDLEILSNAEFPTSALRKSFQDLEMYPTAKLDPFLIHLIGLCHFYGIGTDINLSLARENFSLATSLEFAPSYLFLAYLDFEPSTFEQKGLSFTAFNSLYNAKALGDIISCYYLAKLHDPHSSKCVVTNVPVNSPHIEKIPKKSNEFAIPLYDRATSASTINNIDSWYSLGMCHLSNISATSDQETVENRRSMYTAFHAASQSDHIDSSYKSGLCQISGTGSVFNLQLALANLSFCSEHGNKEATFLHGAFSWALNFTPESPLIDKASLKAVSTGGNYPFATYILGQQAFSKNNYLKAYRLFETIPDFLDSHIYLGDILSSGNGVALNYEKALEHYRTIADADPVAISNRFSSIVRPSASYLFRDRFQETPLRDLSKCLPIIMKDPTAPDLDNCKAAIRNLAYISHMKALLAVSRCYLNGQGLPENTSPSPSISRIYLSKVDSMPEFIPVWESNTTINLLLTNHLTPFTKFPTRTEFTNLHHEILISLAKLYLFGATGVKKQPEKAAELLLLCTGHPEAAALRGIMYYRGIVPCPAWISNSATAAERLFLESAKHQHYLGTFYLGQLYYSRKQYETAFALFLTSATSNESFGPALYNLGVCFYLGHGITRSFSKAAEYFHKGAIVKHSASAYSLALMWSLNQVSPTDPVIHWDQVVRWASFAAQQDHPKAMELLGDCYYFGHGLCVDHEKASFWFEKAASLNIISSGDGQELKYILSQTQ